jgi:amino acid transporter
MASGRTGDEELIKRDMQRLHAMGYAQELKRAMSGFSNFAISFTIISILSGCLTLFGSGMNSAGPLAGSIGWPLVSFFVVMVALSMAELASAYPTAGGLYYWASKLGGAGWGWYTGWFNLIGQVAVTAGIDYGLATFVNILLNTWFGTVITPQNTLIIYFVALVLHATMNVFGVRLVALLNDVSAWWHVIGVLIIVAVLLLVPKQHSLGQAFHTGFTTSGFPYWYAFLLGLLLAQYTFTGYDASAHMTEETIGAEMRAPRGVVMSVVVSAVAGYILLMGLLVAMPTVLGKADLASCKSAGFVNTGDCATYVTAVTNGANPVGYILNTTLGTQLGTLLLTIAVVAQFFCGMSSITANSRMIYAFSRDGAIPLSGLWHRLHRTYRTPANAIMFGAFFSFLLAVPSLWNYTAYVAITSIAVIGLYISYIIPVYLRRRAGTSFQLPSWNLGTWSPLVNWIAIAWVVLTSILFMLPTISPASWNPGDWTKLNYWASFNYTSVVLIVVVVALTIWWYASVRNWFKGPMAQGSELELARIEAGFEEGERSTTAGAHPA